MKHDASHKTEENFLEVYIDPQKTRIRNPFSSIHNNLDINNVERLLNIRCLLYPYISCTLKAFRPCLECDKSIFSKRFYLRTNGTMQSPHISICLVLIVILFWLYMIRK